MKRIVVVAVAVAVTALNAWAQHNMHTPSTPSTVITGAAIQDATAQRLYFVSIMNMPTARLAAHFRNTVGLKDPDITAAMKEVAEFKVQYDENTTAYNRAVGPDSFGYTPSLGADFRTRQSAVVLDSLSRMESSLSGQGFALLRSNIQSAKEKMKVGQSAQSIGTAQDAEPTNPMGCCYNSVITDTWSVISQNPVHLTWTHEETIEGSASGIYPGVTHYANIALSANGHTWSGYSPRVSPTTYLQFSGSITLDSNSDSCLAFGNACSTSDTGNVICSASGALILLSFRGKAEIAWSQSVWNGTPPASPIGCSQAGPNLNSACYYTLQSHCSINPPDFWVSYVQSGFNFTGQTPAYWTSFTVCFAPAVLGVRVGPYKCPNLAFSPIVTAGLPQPPYPCTASNTLGTN